MPLSPLHWRKLPVQSVGSWSVQNILDAVYTAYTSGTYYDGESRTPGSGSALTITSRSGGEAMEMAYAGGDPNVRFVLCGRNGAATPTMNGVDNYTANKLYGTLSRGSSTYDDWENNPIFTGGTSIWGGLYTLTDVIGAATEVHCYESEQAHCIEIAVTSGASYSRTHLGGGWIDPDSTDPSDSEATYNNILALAKSEEGGNGNAFLSQTTQGMFEHNFSGNEEHFVYFTPNTVGLNVARKHTTYVRIGSTTENKLVSGKYAPTLMEVSDPNSPYQKVGRMREIYAGNNGHSGIALESNGVDVGYWVGCRTVDLNENRMLLRY